eukprot:356792-Chlamydomonas_euryale.AAC.3
MGPGVCLALLPIFETVQLRHPCHMRARSADVAASRFHAAQTDGRSPRREAYPASSVAMLLACWWCGCRADVRGCTCARPSTDCSCQCARPHGERRATLQHLISIAVWLCWGPSSR